MKIINHLCNNLSNESQIYIRNLIIALNSLIQEI